MNIVKIIGLLAATGGLGFINVQILYKLGAIELNKLNGDNKKVQLLGFSVINYALYLLIFWVLNETLSKLNDDVLVALAILATLLVTSIFTVCVFWPTVVGMTKLLNKLREKFSKKTAIDEVSTRYDFFSVNAYQEIYIFKFDGTYIASGYTGYVQSSDFDYFDLTLHPFNGRAEESMVNIQKRASSESENPQELIDFEKQIKIFMFPQKIISSSED